MNDDRDEVTELADRLQAKQRRGEAWDLEFEVGFGALTDEERDRFMALKCWRSSSRSARCPTRWRSRSSARDTAWTMSEETVEIVRRAFAYEVYGVGDRAEAEAIFDPNFVMNVTEEGPSYGLDAMQSKWERWTSAWDELKVTMEEIIDAGDQVVVVAYHQGRGRGSGLEVGNRFYELYTLRDGMVVRVDEFTDRAEALEAAGLRE